MSIIVIIALVILISVSVSFLLMGFSSIIDRSWRDEDVTIIGSNVCLIQHDSGKWGFLDNKTDSCPYKIGDRITVHTNGEFLYSKGLSKK